MIYCPIAEWKKQQPKKIALQSATTSLTYEALDTLIQRLCHSLKSIPAPVLALTVQSTPLDIAFFFAAWRLKKAVYPLSFRLPKEAREERLAFTGAHWIDPQQIPLSTPLEIGELEETSLATLIETSGTHATPKIVCHRLGNHLISAKSAVDALSLKEEDGYCLNLPLFHISGLSLTLRTFLAGATLLLPDQWEKATHISFVPTQLYRMMEKGTPLPPFKCLLIGGAPLSLHLYEKATQQGLPLYISYGMTETSAMATLKTPPIPSLNVGAPLPHIQLKLQEGEIHMRGPSLFQNYWGGKKRLDEEWFATKDLGKINDAGHLEIIGRKDRQFISGGENIQPEEIEHSLLQLPHILHAKVEPMADPEFGMRPKAKILASEPLSAETLQEQLKGLLPSFKIPKVFEISYENQGAMSHSPASLFTGQK